MSEMTEMGASRVWQGPAQVAKLVAVAWCESREEERHVAPLEGVHTQLLQISDHRHHLPIVKYSSYRNNKL